MTDRPSDEAVELMVALVRRMAARKEGGFGFTHFPSGARAFLDWSDYRDAVEIVPVLPKPVDPAILACRKALCEAWPMVAQVDWIMGGGEDDGSRMMACLAAYRAGQEAGK